MKSPLDEKIVKEARQNIGEQIRIIREQRGLSQQDVADKIGIDRATISKIEKGNWNFGIDTLTILSHFLEIDLIIEAR